MLSHTGSTENFDVAENFVEFLDMWDLREEHQVPDVINSHHLFLSNRTENSVYDSENFWQLDMFYEVILNT